MEDVVLNCFINNSEDPREIKRGMAVKMRLEKEPRKKVAKLLNVGVDYVSKWTRIYKRKGVKGLRLKYKGSESYLKPSEREKVVEWLRDQDKWDVASLVKHIKEEYDVIYQSKQSYYDLMKEAGLSWKKVQRSNPKKDPEAIANKRVEIEGYLKEKEAEIKSGQRLIFFSR